MSHLGPYLFRRRFVDNIGSQFTVRMLDPKLKALTSKWKWRQVHTLIHGETVVHPLTPYNG